MFPSGLNHHRSSAGCVPAGRCALCHQPGSCLAGVLVLMVDEAMELSRDEKRVRGGRKAGRRREELLSLHAGASPSRLGDHIFRPLLP